MRPCHCKLGVVGCSENANALLGGQLRDAGVATQGVLIARSEVPSREKLVKLSSCGAVPEGCIFSNPNNAHRPGTGVRFDVFFPSFIQPVVETQG